MDNKQTCQSTFTEYIDQHLKLVIGPKIVDFLKVGDKMSQLQNSRLKSQTF